MVPMIDDKRDSIIAICRKYGVVELHVFGSALTDAFDPDSSDVDFLVEFGPMDGHTKAHAYFDMLDELRALFDADVDLVMVGAVKNRYIAADIERSKQVLYAA